jgi:hypothetical protein
MDPGAGPLGERASLRVRGRRRAAEIEQQAVEVQRRHRQLEASGQDAWRLHDQGDPRELA